MRASHYPSGVISHAQPLRRDDLLPDPIAQFLIWFAAAGQAGVHEPEAMALATATPDGIPSVRMVLLKGVDERGFVFFTNREGRKGQELETNPHAALLFRWEPLGRQLRIEGTVEHLPEAESDAYFDTRSLGSRLGAMVSPQSRPIASRAWLEGRIAEVAAATAASDAPPVRPAHWGGYLVRPSVFQYWQHRSDRVHDSFRYAPAAGDPSDAGGGWRIERLGP